jgi:hypothetical protein
MLLIRNRKNQQLVQKQVTLQCYYRRPIVNKKLLVVVGATIATTGLYSASVSAANVTANASANVLAPLDITLGTNAMDFGDVSGDADNATTVLLTTAGTTSSGDGALVGGTPTAGDFDVSGSGTAAYDITLPLDGVVTLTGPGDPMSVDGFTDSAGGSSSLTTGTDSFTVGATLTINANQSAGPYTGTYDVTVEYQ